MPAVDKHTTATTDPDDETYMIRAIDTGVINVGRNLLFICTLSDSFELSLSVQESATKLQRVHEMRDRKTRYEIEEEGERIRKEQEEEEAVVKRKPEEEEGEGKGSQDSNADGGFVV